MWWCQNSVVFGCYERLGELGDHPLTAVMFQGDSNAPTGFVAESPGLAALKLGVNDHVDAEGTEWCDAILELCPCKEVPR
jgi:hypothetical protein